VKRQPRTTSVGKTGTADWQQSAASSDLLMFTHSQRNASNASHVPNVLTAYAAQSHPNCRPSDLLPTMSSATLAVSPEQTDVDQLDQSE
jgi:hypothetical protein